MLAIVECGEALSANLGKKAGSKFSTPTLGRCRNPRENAQLYSRRHGQDLLFSKK